MEAQGNGGQDGEGSAGSTHLTLTGTCHQQIKKESLLSVGEGRSQMESMLCWDREVTHISQAAEITRTYFLKKEIRHRK